MVGDLDLNASKVLKFYLLNVLPFLTKGWPQFTQSSGLWVGQTQADYLTGLWLCP